MRVFVTGASGHIGSALVPELLGAGHQVLGLARSDSSAASIVSRRRRGPSRRLDDLDGLGEAAAAADGVIHLAFKHEAMRAGDFAARSATIGARRDVRGGPGGLGKPFVRTSGTLMLEDGGRPGSAGNGAGRSGGRPAGRCREHGDRASPSAGSARRSCGCRRSSTARSITTASARF